jgi:hypothetical protein
MVTGFNIYHQIAPHPFVTIESGLCVISEIVLLGFVVAEFQLNS